MNVQLSPEFYEDKAKNELNETESRKKQALEQLKEILSKHPFIRHEYDEYFLLSMLRTTKYSVDGACGRIEQLIVISKSFPFPEIPLEDVFKKKDIVYVLKERDESGCRVILIDFAKIPVEDYAVSNCMLNVTGTCLVLANENETQICGIKLIYDFRNFTLTHMKKSLEADVVSILTGYNAFFLRIKEIKLIGMPTFIVSLCELILNGLKPKLRKRIVFDKKLDPEPTDDDIEDVRGQIFEKGLDIYLLDAKVDMEAMKKHARYELVGSFRKLDID